MKSRKSKKNTSKRVSLKKVLNKNEKIKKKVEVAANELTTVNEALNQGSTHNGSIWIMKEAIAKNENVEQVVADAAEELHEVNEELAREISERERMEAELARVSNALSKSQEKEMETQKSAHQDALTGLPDRAVLDQVLDKGIIEEKRHGTGFAVMFVDVDDFKQINDTYGHDLGDKVLLMVANRLQASVRKGDIVSRWDGDEFVCLLLNVKQEADVIRIAEKMLDQIAEDWKLDGKTLSIRASLGIAIYPKDGKTADTLFKNADKAMNKAKESKKKIVLFE